MTSWPWRVGHGDLAHSGSTGAPGSSAFGVEHQRSPTLGLLPLEEGSCFSSCHPERHYGRAQRAGDDLRSMFGPLQVRGAGCCTPDSEVSRID